MPRPFSTDLRTRVVAHHKETGDGSVKLSRLFKIAPSTAYRWIQREQEEKTVEPRVATRKGPTPKIQNEALDDLRSLVGKNSDHTLQQLCDAWKAKTGVTVDDATMHRALVRAGLSLKKRRTGPRSGTATTS